MLRIHLNSASKCIYDWNYTKCCYILGYLCEARLRITPCFVVIFQDYEDYTVSFFF